MANKVALHHRTQYRYDKPVSLGPQVIQLRPTPHCRTPILSYALDITPADRVLNWQLDPHSNYLARAIFPSRTREFAVDVKLVADLAPINPFAFLLEPGFENFPFTYSTEMARDLEPYRRAEPAGLLLRAFLDRIPREPQGTISFLLGLSRRVAAEIGYTTRMEHGVQSCEETLSLHTGSCRDSAWLLVQVCRHLGIAARFVSGYLIQLAPDEPSSDPAAPTEDHAAFHAWAEVFLPGAGWLGFDPTSGLVAAEGHIPLVCTPTAAQAAPIGGTVEPAEVELAFELTVTRLDRTPSLARPYSDTEWAAVQKLAHEIDEDLLKQDVRLTMGGEPTFVGIDEVESPQWNLEALGPLKRTRGLALIRCLREKTAPGGLLQFGQGKWYPGEALPRWAYHCISRLDGVPVWENVDLIATEDEAHVFHPSDALAFLQALSRRLQVSAENILPAFNPKSETSDERPDDPAGYLIPLRRRRFEGHLFWSSQLWFERPERLELAPGDSPIGYRILVESMPWVAPDEIVHEYEAEPYGDRVKLPARGRLPHLFAQVPVPDPLPPLSRTAETATELIRPALCVEVREGRLHVFLPYASVAADFLELVAAVEETCAHLKMPVWIEGYSAPFDPRLRAFSLTPDPGVLEVNLPPTSNWDELERLNAILFEEAQRNRLTALKYGYDGSRGATGGGSHIVLGGATVPDSPILRRPDLLRSMLTFWQNHPSLSFLFSGLYVGPTSQYPRVDEARADALYELEVAFSQLSADCGPEALDGLFRNLLSDITGNTHRAEFCIDKLYPPQGAGLRAGLLELRAFEMAPHFRMGLVEMLLVRALVCVFWKQAFNGTLIRWGSALHDRFMLPHFVQRDFVEVLAYLRAAGIKFDDAWFVPHFEFRFPLLGAMGSEGVEVELRSALEPWNVLAEDSTSGGTVRSVDSSLERIQVKVSGLTAESRYVVACNGRFVPLHPSGTAGESIAGIRFRARKLNAALHPTIPVHSPLTFDLIDTWRSASVARCVFHAGRPDGGFYPSRAADADEAAARRRERFIVSALPEGPISAPEPENNPIFPMTLDMRWPSPQEIYGKTRKIEPGAQP